MNPEAFEATESSSGEEADEDRHQEHDEDRGTLCHRTLILSRLERQVHEASPDLTASAQQPALID
jgi:hypothetical protein